MSNALLQQDIGKITEALQQAPESEEAIIFGSRAKGINKPGSDVDLAIKETIVNFSVVSRLSFLLKAY